MRKATVRNMKSIWSKRSEKKELKRAALDHLRDEKLNRIILNEHDTDTAKRNASKPYDVNYENGSQSSYGQPESLIASGMPTMMIQLVENTELSSRKFVFDPANRIRIGSGLSNNDIVIANSDIEECQCEIFLAQHKIYIRNTGHKVRTIVKRKREQTIVDDKGIRILTGDKIILGKISYEVTIIEA